MRRLVELTRVRAGITSVAEDIIMKAGGRRKLSTMTQATGDVRTRN